MMKVAVTIGNLEITIKVEPSTKTNKVAEPKDNELEIQGDTLRDVLTELVDGYQDKHNLRDILGPFINPQSKAEPAYAILVNGRHYQFLPEGIDTKLKEGDEVFIISIMFGGG